MRDHEPNPAVALLVIALALYVVVMWHTTRPPDTPRIQLPPYAASTDVEPAETIRKD